MNLFIYIKFLRFATKNYIKDDEKDHHNWREGRKMESNGRRKIYKLTTSRLSPGMLHSLYQKKMFMTLNILKCKEFLFCLEKSSPLVLKMEFGIFGCYFLFLHEMSQMRLTAGRKLIAEVISNFGIMNFPFLRSEFGSQSRD